MHGTKRFDLRVHAVVGGTSAMRARELERYLLISVNAALRPHQLLDSIEARHCEHIYTMRIAVSHQTTCRTTLVSR